jgi:hypothetical protein
MLLSSGYIVVGKVHFFRGNKNPYKGPKKYTKLNVPSTSNKVSNDASAGAS